MGTVPASSALGLVRHGLALEEDDRAKDGPLVEFHCTGFGPFHNVTVNPTELLIRELPSYLNRHPLPPSCKLASATVLETAAVASRVLLERMYDKVEGARVTTTVPSSATASSDLRQHVVVIHLGVNVAVKQFELELQARNEATFSCPDEAGWIPVKSRIDPDTALPLDHVRQTLLPVHRLVVELRASGFDVGVSTDAGRFVCNWVYYNSLRLAERKNVHSLFVHVPAHDAQPLEAQLRFFATLLHKISLLEF
jgi:pyroglutamyl-peptidase